MRWPGACLPGARPHSTQATWSQPHTAQVQPPCRAIPTTPDANVDAVRSNRPRELWGGGCLLFAGASIGLYVKVLSVSPSFSYNTQGDHNHLHKC